MKRLDYSLVQICRSGERRGTIDERVVWQDAENVRQQRSRIVQTLNVPRGYASALHSLRPCWTALLSILREYSPSMYVRIIGILAYQNSFSATC